jgi:hypothetical protein
MLGALQSLGYYHRFLPPHRLPEELGLVNSFPTLLHRFVRQGDVPCPVRRTSRQ